MVRSRKRVRSRTAWPPPAATVSRPLRGDAEQPGGQPGGERVLRPPRPLLPQRERLGLGLRLALDLRPDEVPAFDSSRLMECTICVLESARVEGFLTIHSAGTFARSHRSPRVIRPWLIALRLLALARTYRPVHRDTASPRDPRVPGAQHQAAAHLESANPPPTLSPSCLIHCASPVPTPSSHRLQYFHTALRPNPARQHVFGSHVPQFVEPVFLQQRVAEYLPPPRLYRPKDLWYRSLVAVLKNQIYRCQGDREPAHIRDVDGHELLAVAGEAFDKLNLVDPAVDEPTVVDLLEARSDPKPDLVIKENPPCGPDAKKQASERRYRSDVV